MFDSFFQSLSKSVSFPEDQLRCLSGLLLAYPLAFAFRLLPVTNPNFKHLASVLVSFFLFVAILDDLVGLMHLLGSSIAVWRIMGSVKGKWGPRIVFIGVMTHMSVRLVDREKAVFVNLSVLSSYLSRDLIPSAALFMMVAI